MGRRLHARADALEAAGHRMSAGNYYLRAGMYYFTAERFIYPGPDKREMGRIAIDCQTKGILRRHPNVERVEVPFEGAHTSKSLPAFFMKALNTNAERAPTIVVFNGMDNCKEMSVLFAGLDDELEGLDEYDDIAVCVSCSAPRDHCSCDTCGVWAVCVAPAQA